MTNAALDVAEFKAAWRIVLLAMVGVALSANAALLYGFGALIVPLEQQFGWTRAEQQSTITFLYLGAVVGLQLVGWLNLRFGVKRVTIASFVLSILIYALATIILPAFGSIWTLYLTVALIPILGAGCMIVTWTQLVGVWFHRNRGLALAIALSGTGVGGATIPLLIAWGVEQWDWRAGFLALAFLNLAIGLPLAALWFKMPNNADAIPARAASEPASPGASFAEAASSLRFWVLTMGLSLVVAAVVSMATSTIPMLQLRGFEAAEAAAIFSTFGLALIGGRVVVGYLLDRLWPAGVSAFALFLPALGCALLMWGGQRVEFLVAGAFLIGVGAGAEFDIAAFLVARYFGMREYARLFGLHLGVVTAAGATAPLVSGALIARADGAYDGVLLFSLGCFVAGALSLLTLGRAPPAFGFRRATEG